MAEGKSTDCNVTFRYETNKMGSESAERRRGIPLGMVMSFEGLAARKLFVGIGRGTL